MRNECGAVAGAWAVEPLVKIASPAHQEPRRPRSEATKRSMKTGGFLVTRVAGQAHLVRQLLATHRTRSALLTAWAGNGRTPTRQPGSSKVRP